MLKAVFNSRMKGRTLEALGHTWCSSEIGPAQKKKLLILIQTSFCEVTDGGIYYISVDHTMLVLFVYITFQ